MYKVVSMNPLVGVLNSCEWMYIDVNQIGNPYQRNMIDSCVESFTEQFEKCYLSNGLILAFERKQMQLIIKLCMPATMFEKKAFAKNIQLLQRSHH